MKQNEIENINDKINERVRRYRGYADKLICHYILNNLEDKDKAFDEIYRIGQIIKSIPIRVKEKKSLFFTQGWFYGREIVMEVADINEFISGKGSEDFIVTMIHELYHAISKTKIENKNHYIEEGYVTEITSETIKYAIDNPDYLKKEYLTKATYFRKEFHGYPYPSEFVRSIQVIMKNYGYNSMFEYIFSENGFERLIKIAQEINPELAEIIAKQSEKSPFLGNYSYELEIIKSMLDGIDLTNISETDVENNELLQDYLIEKGIINGNPQLGDMVKKYNSSYKFFKASNSQVANMSRDELLSYIKNEIEGIDFDYQTHNDRTEDVRRITEIIHFGYDKSSISPKMFDTKIYFAKLVAYDLYQRGVKLPADVEYIKEYASMLYPNPMETEAVIEMVQAEIESIYEKASNGAKISSIINDTIVNQTFMGIEANREVEEVNTDNYWKKVQNLASLNIEQKVKNGENFYVIFYNAILEITQKYVSQNTDNVYNQKDFDEFRKRMTFIFKQAGVPIELMNKVGLSVEKIYLKSISENIKDENRNEQVKVLLECIKNNDMHLGKNTNDLQDFTYNICEVYENIRKQNNPEEINSYMTCLLDVFYNKGFGEANSTRIDKIENPSIKHIISDYALSPIFFNDANTAKNIFKQFPDIYKAAIQNSDFYKEIICYLPEDMQNKIDINSVRGMWDINEVVVGKKFPKVDDFSECNFDDINPVAKFYIIYDRYREFTKTRRTEEAETLWNMIYGKDIEDQEI